MLENQNISENKKQQDELIQQLCSKHSVNYSDLCTLLETEKAKKLLTTRHYIQQTIAEIIERNSK